MLQRLAQTIRDTFRGASTRQLLRSSPTPSIRTSLSGAWKGLEPLEPRVLLSSTSGPVDLDNQLSEATAIDAATVVGAVDAGNDVDVYVINAQANHWLTFDIDAAEGSTLNSYLRIFNAQGRQLAVNDNGAAPGETVGSDSFIRYTTKSSGLIYVAVSSARNQSYNVKSGAGARMGSTTGGYQLTIQDITPDETAGQTLGTARDLGSPTGSTTISEYVGSLDPSDYYRFTLDSTAQVQLSLTDLTADANLELIRDSNSNGRVDGRDVLAYSRMTRTQDESISRQLTAGTYYLRVLRRSGEANYQLGLDVQGMPEITVTGNNANIVNGDTTPAAADGTSFATSYVGEAGTTRTFTVRNDGYDVLNLADLDLPSGFTLVEGLSANLAAGESDTFTVQMNTATAGAKSGQIRITSNDSDESAFAFTISGTVSLPPAEITVLWGDVEITDGDLIASLLDGTDFGSVDQGDAGPTLTLTVRNDGGTTLSLGSLSLPSGFVLVEGLSSSLAAGESDTFTIGLSTGAAGVKTGQVVFQTSDSDEATFNFAITGTVVGLPGSDWFSLNISDSQLQALGQSLFGDSQIDRSDMIAILRSASDDDGLVSAQELADLRLIVNSATTLGMADYVQVLAEKVVFNYSANAYYQSTALGNLAAGSTDAQLDKLIGKWFLGSDRPEAKAYGGGSTYQYRLAAGELFVDGADYTDIVQGNVGDCYFVATLGSIAQHDEAAIRDMFIDNGDGTYTVRFFHNGVADYVTVDRYLPTNSSGYLMFANYYSQVTNPGNELWVALAEKAYAQINEEGWIYQSGTNSYQGLSGGWMGDVYEQVLNIQATDLYRPSQSTIVNAFSSGTMITLGSKSTTSNGVIGGHAYILTGYDAATGKFTLYNPWGEQHPAPLTWSQVMANFDWFCLA